MAPDRRSLRVGCAGLVVLALLATGCGDEAVEAPATQPDYAQSASYARRTEETAAPALKFTDVTSVAGIHFTHTNGAFGEKWMPETMGSGVAFDDLDGDGDADALLVSGTWWPGHEGEGPVPTSALYANDGSGVFRDVTAGSGVDVPVQGMGITAADYDGDGDTDLYLTTLGPNLLLRQERTMRFRNVADRAGVAGATWTDEKGRAHPEWSTASVWVDADHDGLLDLFVANYVKWSPENDLYFSFDGESKSYATPQQYEGSTPRLYRNLGDGRFEEITAAAGVSLPHAKSMGVAVADFDEDGRSDLVVTNDTQPNFLLHNVGGRFEEVGLAAGIGYDESGRARAGMGVDVARLTADGPQTIGIGNFSREALSLYQQTSTRGRVFLDVAGRAQLVQSTLPTLTFGLRFVDVDLDGRQDLLLANGHIEPEINAVQKEIAYAQPPQVFWNDGSGRLIDASATAGPAFATPMVARGLATADMDADGDPDVLLSTNAGPATLLRNDRRPADDAPHAIAIDLVGPGAGGGAVGTRVEVRAGTERQRATLRTGSSYMSQSHRRLLFGLGEAAMADRITIRWPVTRVTHLDRVEAGYVYRVGVDGIIDRSALRSTR